MGVVVFDARIFSPTVRADEAIRERPPPRIIEVDLKVRRRIDRLEQLMQLVVVGETEPVRETENLEQTDEALDRIVGLLDVALQSGLQVSGRPASQLLGAVPLGDGRFISLGEYCQRQLARLPPAARARYRRQVDPVAEAWYAQGIADRDGPLLRRLVDQMFFSRWGDNGLLALGEMALERADYQQARIDWVRIVGTRPPSRGEIALENTPTDQVPAGLLAYPDSELDPAMVWARLALVSIRANQFTRADREIDQLRKAFPKARGMLGGKEEIYADRLAQLLDEALHEPFPRAPAKEGPLARSQAVTLRQQWTVSLSGEIATPRLIVEGRVLCYGDWSFGDWVLPEAVKSARPSVRLHAVELVQGHPAMGGHSTIFRFPQEGDRWQVGQATPQEAPTIYLAGDSDRYVWATLLASPSNSPGNQGVAGRGAKLSAASHGMGQLPLVGLDLHRDGALCFRQLPPAERWAYSGPPLVSRAPEDGRRVLVAMIEQTVSRRIWIACYQVDSGRLIWRRALCDMPIGKSVEPGLAAHTREPPVVLTLDGAVVYCNTNRGVVAALRVRDGRLQWLRTYPRAVAPRKAALPGSSTGAVCRRPNACLFHQGLLLIAPTDSLEVLALDAASGIRVWSRRDPHPEVDVLGTMGDKLILVGDRLWAIDTVSGDLVEGWGDSTVDWGRQEDRAGEGVIAGQTIYWPWAGKIWALDGTTGGTTALKCESASEPAGEEQASGLPRKARLLLAGDRLVAAGPGRITVYQVIAAGSNGQPVNR
jgi:hypothetical protein